MKLMMKSEMPDWAFAKNFKPLENESQETYLNRAQVLLSRYESDYKAFGRLILVCPGKKWDSKHLFRIQSGYAFWSKDYIAHPDFREVVNKEIAERCQELIDYEFKELGDTVFEKQSRERYIQFMQLTDRNYCPVCYSSRITLGEKNYGLLRVIHPTGIWDFKNSCIMYDNGFFELGGVYSQCFCVFYRRFRAMQEKEQNRAKSQKKGKDIPESKDNAPGLKIESPMATQQDFLEVNRTLESMKRGKII